MGKAKKIVAGSATAAVIATTTAFLPNWEGMDEVAKKDMIGTGHPVTYCYGQTDEFGAVKVGTRFPKRVCDEKLAESLPNYLEKLDKCITVPLPVKAVSALLDASYNAGTGAVCRSPMLARMNRGNLREGCDAFRGWYIRSAGKVRNGLIARRSGIDSRKSERDLCLEGLSEPRKVWYTGFEVETMTPPVVAEKRKAEEKKAAEAADAKLPWWKRFFKWFFSFKWIWKQP